MHKTCSKRVKSWHQNYHTGTTRCLFITILSSSLSNYVTSNWWMKSHQLTSHNELSWVFTSSLWLMPLFVQVITSSRPGLTHSLFLNFEQVVWYEMHFWLCLPNEDQSFQVVLSLEADSALQLSSWEFIVDKLVAVTLLTLTLKSTWSRFALVQS